MIEGISCSLYPWAVQVSLWRGQSEFHRFDHTYRLLPFISRPTSICGGTLLAADIVLTAAHCLRESNAVVMISFNKNELYRANYMHASPRYDPREQWYRIAKHDWALLFLERKIPLGDVKCHSESRPIPRIWTKEIDGIQNECFLVGFGQTESEFFNPWPPIQRKAKIISMKEDLKFRTMLIEKTARNAAACQGDSGGPVVCEVNGEWHVIGLLIGGTFHSTHPKTELDKCLTIKRNAFVSFRTLFSELTPGGSGGPLTEALKHLGRFEDVIRFQRC